MKPVLKRTATVVGLVLGLAVAAFAAALVLDRNYPPPIRVADDYSVEVVDRNGELLRVFTNDAGRWRLETKVDDIDPQFLAMLIGYEDKRFYSHHGVDPLALGRAAGQLLWHGRIVSGGSTITMQLARLLEPRGERSMTAKTTQMLRALQIERRLTKREILEMYLTLAPYGGNIEGVRAASLSWFGKEPRKLLLREAALLVAMPQAPESRRPDRYADTARASRDRVMHRLAENGVLDRAEAERVALFDVPRARAEMPRLAPHLAQRAVETDPLARRHATRLDAKLQARLEMLAHDAARGISPRASLAIVVADSKSGDILARIGSPDVPTRSVTAGST